VGEREGALLVLQQDNIYIQCGGGGTAVVVAAAAAARRCCCCHRPPSLLLPLLLPPPSLLPPAAVAPAAAVVTPAVVAPAATVAASASVVVAPAAAVVVAAGAAGVVAAAAARSRVRLAGPLVRVRPSLFCLWYLIVKAQLVFDIVFGTHLCIWVKKTCKICNSECFLTCMGRRDSGGDEEECTRAHTAIFGCVTV